MLDVMSIGGATIDIFVKSKQFIVDNSLISLIHSSKNEIDKSLICSGGGATNSAVSFARLGLKSTCNSLVGQDNLRSYIIDDLKKEKINTKFLVEDKKENTDFSVILVAPDGGRSILTNRGKTRLEEKHFNWKKIPKSKWFYITSLEGNIDLLEQLIGYAKENNVKVSLNPGSRELLQGKKLLPLLKQTDFLLLNKSEAEILTSIDFTDQKFWEKLSSYSSGIIAVTNGRLGAFVVENGHHYFSPVINIKPIDETGAGDSFGSTFVAAQIYKFSTKDSLFWAIKNSASVVSSLGAKKGLLTLKQIKK